jgi:hypothetical protein
MNMENQSGVKKKKVYVRRYPDGPLSTIPEESVVDFTGLATSTDETDKKEGFTRVGPVCTVNEK